MPPATRYLVRCYRVKRFTLIEGGKAARPRRKKPDGEPLLCPSCNSNASETIVLGRRIRQGKIGGGTKQIRCAECKRPLT